MTFLLILAKSLEKQKFDFSCGALFQVRTRVRLEYLVIDCLWKPVLDSNLPQTSGSLIFLQFS